jgi:hypothetical protein
VEKRIEEREELTIEFGSLEHLNLADVNAFRGQWEDHLSLLDNLSGDALRDPVYELIACKYDFMTIDVCCNCVGY